MKGLSDVQNMRMSFREQNKEESQEKSQGQKEINTNDPIQF
jgi:hypothetical protein